MSTRTAGDRAALTLDGARVAVAPRRPISPFRGTRLASHFSNISPTRGVGERALSEGRHRLGGTMHALFEVPPSRDDRPRADQQRQSRARVDPQALVAGLNEPQLAAVTHAGSPLLIVAGAGSGKTRVLAHRIAYLLAARDVHPGEIIAITFTNKAAGEMKERVESLVGPRARIMWVSTFHSACVRILRAEHEHAGLKSSFSIYDADDSRRLMQLVARELDLDPKRYSARSLAAAVSNLKNELIDAGDSHA